MSKKEERKKMKEERAEAISERENNASSTRGERNRMVNKNVEQQKE